MNIETVKKIFSYALLFVIFTTALKFFFSRPKMGIDGELIKMVKEINKKTPIMVDSTTRLDNVEALPGKRFQYNYSITNAEKSNLDTNIILSTTKKNMIEILKSNPKNAYLRDNNIDIFVKYLDKNGAYVCKLELTSNEYK